MFSKKNLPKLLLIIIVSHFVLSYSFLFRGFCNICLYENNSYSKSIYEFSYDFGLCCVLYYF